MSYFDYVDWDELRSKAEVKALTKAVQLFIDNKIESHEVVFMATNLYQDCYDEIWLMGPVPMKPGYNPPIFDADFLKDIKNK